MMHTFLCLRIDGIRPSLILRVGEAGIRLPQRVTWELVQPQAACGKFPIQPWPPTRKPNASAIATTTTTNLARLFGPISVLIPMIFTSCLDWIKAGWPHCWPTSPSRQTSRPHRSRKPGQTFSHRSRQPRGLIWRSTHRLTYIASSESKTSANSNCASAGYLHHSLNLYLRLLGDSLMCTKNRVIRPGELLASGSLIRFVARGSSPGPGFNPLLISS